MRENQFNSIASGSSGFGSQSVPTGSNCSDLAAVEVSTGKRGHRVLIIENEALMAEVLAEILAEMGFEVCGIEATEAGAVASAARTGPHLMIVDANLREGSGISAVEKIVREHFVPHIFVSGDRLSDRGLDPRAIVLQKPFLEAELAQAIRLAIGITTG